MAREAPHWLIRQEGEGKLSIRSRDTGVSELRRYHARKERLIAPFGVRLPPLLGDLVDLALTVYAADRIVRRRPLGAASDRRWWQRRFEIHLPVSSPEEYPELIEIREVLREWLGPVPRAAVQARLMALYRTYCEEWRRFPARPPGWRFGFSELRLTA